MPLTPSPHLGLTRPAGTDPFLRATIVDDLDILDQYPGVFPCLSTARPTWGPDQAGMLISETDTGLLRRWDGTAWGVPENSVRSQRLSLSLSTTLSNNATATYTLGNILTMRPCVINVLVLARFVKAAATPQNVVITPLIGGTDASFGFNDTLTLPDGPAGTTKNYAMSLPAFGSRSISHIGSQNNSLQVKVDVGNAGNTIDITGIKAITWISEN